MEKTAEFNLQEEANKFSNVERRAENVQALSADISTEMGDKARVVEEVKEDGVLTEQEQENTDQYTELEAAALDGDSRKDFLEEMKGINEDKESVRTLKKEKNGKEKELVQLNLEIIDLTNEINQKIEELEAEKEDLARDHDMEIFGMETIAEDEINEIKRKTRANIREVAGILRNDETVSTFREAKSKLKDVSDYFDIDKADVKDKIRAKRDEVAEAPIVDAAKEVIGDQKDSRDAAISERMQRLVNDEAVVRNEYQEKVEKLEERLGSEIEALQEQLEDLEEKRDEMAYDVMDLEAEIEDKQRLESSIKNLKTEIRRFDFSDAEAALADLESRAANSLSLEALETDQENLAGDLEYALSEAEKLGETLAASKEAAETAIREAYEAQAEELRKEKEAEEQAEEAVHNQLVDSLNRPFAAKIEELRAAENLEEGRAAIDLIMSTEGMTDAAKKAGTKIEKSAKALEKFKAKLEGTFAKLNAKLTVARGEAYATVDSKVDSVSKDIDTAKTIAQEAQDGNFQAQGGWLKRTFKRLFSRN